MRKLRMLMMMGCIPMILGAEEYKEPEKINLNKGWEFSQVGKSSLAFWYVEPALAEAKKDEKFQFERNGAAILPCTLVPMG